MCDIKSKQRCTNTNISQKLLSPLWELKTRSSVNDVCTGSSGAIPHCEHL
ncbi:hypothetical protein Anapl_10035 [Anas platyrhynchos]|uniref:Uncharacterized protein n=1 Tax=Anas platyrhynchos TaxID=8839 RepID=R0LXN3_ANAPL|nr:hypothetical protein Anapl_10035 [Anas platyrhynchos]